jgi:GT2 family glycosyltransferase
MTEPRVAILLVNWNGWSDTLDCLENIFRLDYRNFVVVVCDNASSDGSVEQIRAWIRGTSSHVRMADARRGQSTAAIEWPIAFAELTRTEAEAGGPTPGDARIVLVQNGANLGFAEGNNVGLRYLIRQPDIDYVWLLNNDVVVEGPTLTELVRCARSEPGIGAVGATIYEYSEPNLVQAAGGGVFSRRNFVPRLITAPRYRRGGQRNVAPTLDFIAGACMLVRLEELKTVGLIDESFFIYCEDVDFCVRLRAVGSRLVHATAARVWHKGGSTVGHRSERHDYYTVRNTMALVRKHYPLMTPFIATYLIYRAVLPKIVRGQWARLAAGWRGYRDFTKRVTGPAPI